jgi:hypothetical protein
MLIGMSNHELNTYEQQRDHYAPGGVRISKVHVRRGRATVPGTWVEDADIGSVTINVIPPRDNRTPVDMMGYRIRHVGGNLPGPGMIPDHDVRALGGAHGATSTHSPIRLLLSVTAVDLGGNLGAPTYFMVCHPSVAEPFVDELPYDPRTLRILDQGAKGWLLTDGRSRMKMFDNEDDARNGLAVAQRHTRHGFVGRDNGRAHREDYIFEYWAGSSGLPRASLTKVDALPYNPANIFAADLGSQGFRLQDGDHALVLADNVADALAQLRVVKQHSRICFIGRDNRRPRRKSYIMTYWE